VCVFTASFVVSFIFVNVLICMFLGKVQYYWNFILSVSRCVSSEFKAFLVVTKRYSNSPGGENR